MGLGPKASTPASLSWRDLLVYMRETPPAFHTIPDYHAALNLLGSPIPRSMTS
jgi:hypothetical protein